MALKHGYKWLFRHNVQYTTLHLDRFKGRRPLMLSGIRPLPAGCLQVSGERVDKPPAGIEPATY